MNVMPDFADILAPIRARISYRNGMAEKLASIIADLLNEHEPLLKAEADGDVICVSEKGGDLVFAVTVDPQSRGAVRANNVPTSDGSLSGSHASHGALRSPPIGFDPGYKEGSDQ